MATRAPADAGGFLARFRHASLTLKLTVLGAVVTALVVFAAFWALSIQTRRSARTLFAAELRRHQATLLRLQQQNIDQLISSTGLITQSPILRSALETFRVESDFGGGRRPDIIRTVERELDRLLASTNRDLLLVTDDKGVVFASARRGGGGGDGRALAGPARGTDLSGLGAVRALLQPTAAGDSGAVAVLRSGNAAYQLAVYPLSPGGYTIGTLILGERLDDGLLASTRAAFEGHVAVTAGGTLLAGTLADPMLAGRLERIAASDSVGTTNVGGEELVVAPLFLGETQDGEPVRLWLMQPIESTVRALTTPLSRDFMSYGLIAVLVSAIGGTIAARSVLRPFHAFVGYLRSDPAASGSMRPFDSAHHPAEIQSLNDSFQRLMQSMDGSRRELVQRTTELTAANAILTDEIRERERVETALLERDEQLRQSQKLEAVGTLAGGIAHDFNNLLTAMSGFTQLALMNCDPNSPVAQDLRHVVEAADRAGHLTKQLLAFSRKQVLRPSLLDVGEVIHGVAPLFGRLLGDHITLRLDTADDVPHVLADRGQLEQVIMNLAINARDAMPRGGTLAIATRVTGDGPSRSVIIEVTDTGTGIPDELRTRIFEPFFTTKEPGKGTGLGLSTVYGIVTQSGGKVSVDSVVGDGTTFRITLPVAKETAITGVVEPAAEELPRGSETVLLVEDDPAVRSLARRTLEACGYTVLPAGDPLEALSLARTARVDLILSDMLMPHLSGPEMVERFLLDHPAPVVVFMSGYADDGMMADSRSIRAAFVRKPFTPAILAREVRAALDLSKRTPAVALP